MPVSADTLRTLMDAGVTGDVLIAVVERIDADMSKPAGAAAPTGFLSSGAERQARYRARRGLTETAWGTLRLRVLKRDGFVCSYCGAPDADCCVHVTPPARGGLSEESNLVAACISCERSRPGSEWRA